MSKRELVFDGGAVAQRHVLRLHQGPSFDFTSADYEALYADSSATAFQHPAWLSTFYRIVAPARGASALIVTGRCSCTGELAFVLPMVARRIRGVRIVEFADLGVADFAAPVVQRGREKVILDDASIAPLVRQALGPHDLLRIDYVRAEHAGLWQALIGVVPRPEQHRCYHVRLDGTKAVERMERVDKRLAKELARKTRGLERLGALRFERVGLDALPDAISTILGYRKGRVANDLLHDDYVRAFYIEAALAGDADELVRLYRLSVEGTAVGYAFNIASKGSQFGVLLGSDIDSYRRYSPGMITALRCIDAFAAEGGHIFEFGIGDDGYKAKLAGEAGGICSLHRTNSVIGEVAERWIRLVR